MKWISLEEVDGYRRLRIEAPWAEIEADYRDVLARYAKLPVPGFRAGKVPQRVVEQRFRTAILEELSARVARRLGREAIQEAGIEALAAPEASEIECDRDKPFRAIVRYLPMPELQLPDLTGLGTGDDGTDSRDRISRRLLELVPFEVPGDLVRQELRVDGLEESGPGSEAWVAAADRIRLMVILKKIARQEGIDVDETDVAQRITEKAEEFGTTKRDLQTELERGGGTARLQDMLLAERTLEYLMEIDRQ